jgi:AcrR family transcriptional regulator
MVVGSVKRPKIIEVAILLFGRYGYAGVDMRGLAQAANTTTGTVYRLFSGEGDKPGAKKRDGQQEREKQKEHLYDVAVNTAISRALAAAAQSVFALVDDTDDEDALSMIGQALKLWYNAFGQPEARLLMQVEIADPDPQRRRSARVPFQKMGHHLAKAIERVNAGRKVDAPQIASSLLDSLYRLKISEHDHSEQQLMESRIGQLVLLIGRK